MKEKKKSKLICNVGDTKYKVVKHVASKVYGMALTRSEETEWDLKWTDSAVQPEKLCSMKPFQKINHFPGMYSITRKSNLAWSLNKMRKLFPKDYNFYPRTWVLPGDLPDFKAQMDKKKKVFIVKPEASCQGRGIFLVKKPEDLTVTEGYVAQEYVKNPFLLDGLKFDLRVYALVAGCDPLRVFIHEDGLTRLATHQYQKPKKKNMKDACMHLTNYAVNKHSGLFEFNEEAEEDDSGHKRSLKSTLSLFESLGHDANALKERIGDMIVKTLCAIQPSLSHTYRSCQPNDLSNSMCFEILGLDILIDHKLRPWLLEVNHTPSFTTDSPLDWKIKKRVIKESIKMMNIKASNRKHYYINKSIEAQQRSIGKAVRETREERKESQRQQAELRNQWEDAHMGGFTRAYAEENKSSYQQFLQAAEQIWSEWTGTQASRIKRLEEPTINQRPEVVSAPSKLIEESHKTIRCRTARTRCLSPDNNPEIQNFDSKTMVPGEDHPATKTHRECSSLPISVDLKISNRRETLSAYLTKAISEKKSFDSSSENKRILGSKIQSSRVIPSNMKLPTVQIGNFLVPKVYEFTGSEMMARPVFPCRPRSGVFKL